ETKTGDAHKLESAPYRVTRFAGGEKRRGGGRALPAINMRLRDDYTADCQRGLDRWNKIIERIGVPFKLELPHVAFHRQIGEFKDVEATSSGELLDKAIWARDKNKWLPSAADGDFIASLMKPVREPGKFAGWIAAPRVGIDNKPGDFEYVKLAA